MSDEEEALRQAFEAGSPAAVQAAMALCDAEDLWAVFEWAVAKFGSASPLVAILRAEIARRAAAAKAEERVGCLVKATSWGYAEVAKVMIEAGTDPNGRDAENWAPLMVAPADVVQVLIAAGADVNVSGGREGWTPLMYAVVNRHVATVRELIAVGADVNAQEEMTVLGLAVVMRSSTEIVGMLLDAGADVAAQDKDGRTALWIAENKHGGTPPEIVAMLRAAADRAALIAVADAKPKEATKKTTPGGIM